MSYAQAAVQMINALSQSVGIQPAYLFRGQNLDCFDIVDQGSHKYIPSEHLSRQLGLNEGSGVFGYVKFGDGSYVLKLCDNRLAYWSGKEEDSPELG